MRFMAGGALVLLLASGASAGDREVLGRIGTAVIDHYHLRDAASLLRERAQDLDAAPARLAAGSAVSGALLYMNGLHARRSLGAFKIGMDVAPAHKLRRALESGETFFQAAELDISRRGWPVSLRMDWALSQGRFKREQVGLKYQKRF